MIFKSLFTGELKSLTRRHFVSRFVQGGLSETKSCWCYRLRVSSLLLNFQLMIELAAKPVPTATRSVWSLSVQIIPLVLSWCIAPCAINSSCNVNPSEIYCVNFKHNFNILQEVQGVRTIGLLLHSHWLNVMLRSWNGSYNDTTALTYTDTVHLVFIALGLAEFPPSLESCNSLLLEIWIKFDCIQPCACSNMRWKVSALFISMVSSTFFH